MKKKADPIPEGFHTITPYLMVSDGDACIAFLKEAFGATLVGRHADSEGKLRHAELRIGDSMLMLGEGNEEWPPTRSMMHLFVEDIDRWYQRCLSAGARSVREPEDMFYGDRTGGVEDPFGNQWWISTHLEDVSPEELARRQSEMETA